MNVLIIINQLTKKFIINDFEIIKFDIKIIINIELIFWFYYYIITFMKFKWQSNSYNIYVNMKCIINLINYQFLKNLKFNYLMKKIKIIILI